jgi:hypothetical protein
MIEISTPEIAIWPSELDFGLGVGTEKRGKIQAFLVVVSPKGIFRLRKGTKWVGNT